MARVEGNKAAAAHVDWGVVPGPIIELMKVFKAKIAQAAEQLADLDWNRNETPSDVSPFFIDLLRASQQGIDAATDLRTLTTAYAQTMHQPRPTLARLAEAQRSSSAGLVKRYTPITLNAINELLSDTPKPLIVERAFRSIALRDLATCSPAMEREVSKLLGTKHDKPRYTYLA